MGDVEGAIRLLYAARKQDPKSAKISLMIASLAHLLGRTDVRPAFIFFFFLPEERSDEFMGNKRKRCPWWRRD